MRSTTRGGLLGRDVELAVGDTNSSPLEARRQYQRLVLEEDADVTVGVFDSPSLETIIEDIAEQETIHLTTGAATSAVSRKVSENYDRYKYHFRVGPTNDRDLGNSLIDFLDTNAENIGWNSVAVLVEDYPWSEGPWDVMQDQLDDVGVDIAMDQRYPPATNDFTDIYTDVARSGADAAFVGMAHTGIPALTYWARGQFPFAFGGIHVPMQLPNYWELTGGACQSGISLISATANSEVGNLTQDFVDRYENEYDSTPVYTGYTSYEAVKLYAHVAEERGTQSTDELIPALEDVSFNGATGTIEFYDKDHQFAHDLMYKPVDNLYMQWQADGEGGGTQEVIWPEKHSTSEYVSPHWL